MKNIWEENHPLVALWIYGLMALFAISSTSLIVAIITGQVDISNITFGVFDYI